MYCCDIHTKNGPARISNPRHWTGPLHIATACFFTYVYAFTIQFPHDTNNFQNNIIYIQREIP